ncbi:DUF2254 domain-containing protein [soil metagenome]
MNLNLRWLVQDIKSQLWFTVALYCALGLLAALGALFLNRLIPDSVSSQIGADAVDRILGILAASMLAVTTFSISTMVQAFASAANGATPRAAQLVIEDSTAQQALATFIGAFVFSLVGLIALSTGAYGSSGRLVLFVATIAVVVLIVVMLLRWIQRLSKLGRLGETVDQVEHATLAAIKSRREKPCLGGRPAVAIPDNAGRLVAHHIGYVRRIDMDGLARLAEKAECDIHVCALPGTFVSPDRPLAAIAGEVSDKIKDDFREKLEACFMIGDQRSFEQDPRFGLVVLSEVASRALSPAVNDPGTAIDVIGTVVRIMAAWSEASDSETDEVSHARVYVAALAPRDMLDDAFVPIARDGAGLVEVGIRLQKALRTMAQFGDAALAEAARDHAHMALARAEQALAFGPDRARLAAVASGGM